MVNEEKDNDSTTTLNLENTEKGVSESKTNPEETVVVSETEEKVKQITEETKNEENANEGNNGANEEEEEADEENAEEGNDEEKFQEEEEGEEEEEEEEEENNDNIPMEEDIAEEEKIEENNGDSPIKEDIVEEKKEEQKEEKTEPVPKDPVKTSKKRIRNKTIVAKDKDKPEPSVKKPPIKKAKTAVAAKDKEEEGATSAGKKRPAKKAKTVVAAKEDEKEPALAAKKTPAKKAKTVVAAKEDEKEPASAGKKTPPSKKAKASQKESKDKPESSGKKKPSKKKESMGMIFMCSSKTKKDCYRYKVFGLPAGKKEMVQKIYKGMRLFLYDIDLKLMYGIYKAAAPGGFNIEPKAFNSAYPSQVRFTILEECEPLGEEKFKKVIKENYYSRNKFDCQLNSNQVKNLCKLFAFANKGTPKSKRAARSVIRAEPRQSSGRGGRIQRRVPDEPRRPPRSPRRPARRYIDRRPVDRQVVYEREAFVQPPMHNVQPLPAARVPAAPLPYDYEMEAYRRDPPPREHRGRSYLDYEPTRRDEIGSRDRYYYREREPLSYAREYNYIPAPAEYNYVPAPALPTRYHYPEPATSDYRSSASGRAEYQIPAAEGRQTEYRSSGRNRVYRL